MRQMTKSGTSICPRLAGPLPACPTISSSRLFRASGRRLIDAGLMHFLHMGALGLTVAPELLTPAQHKRLAQIRTGQ